MTVIGPSSGPATRVDPAPNEAGPINLLDAARVVTPTDDDWIGGLCYPPEACVADIPGVTFECPGDGGDEAPLKTIGVGAGYAVSLSPFTFGGDTYDGTFGAGSPGLVVFAGDASDNVLEDDQISTNLDGTSDIHVVLVSAGGGFITVYVPANLYDGAETTAGMQTFFDTFPGGPFTVDNVKYAAFTANGSGDDYTWNGFSDFTEAGAVDNAEGFPSPPTLEAADGAVLSNPDTRCVKPFIAYAGDVCSPQDRTRDRRGRALRKLDACLPGQVERELWSGVISRAAAFDNPYLADENATVLPDSASTEEVAIDRWGYVTALGKMEQALCACSCGGRKMIHATPELVDLWISANLLYRAGRVLYTISKDTVVVPGCGYNGSAPDDDENVDNEGLSPAATESWFYGTGMVTVYLSTPDVIGDDPADSIQIADNLQQVRAERAVAVTWDGCCQIASKADHLEALGATEAEEEA